MTTNLKIGIKYIVSIFVLLMALVILFRSPLSSLFLLISGLVFFPPLENILFQSVPFFKPLKWRIAISVLTFFIALGVDGGKKNNKNSNDLSLLKKDSALVNTKMKEIPKSDKTTKEVIVIPKYEIYDQIINKRYDGAVEYFVLIPTANIKNSAFKKDVKIIINDMVAKNGGKLSINFIDSKKAMDIAISSHYGNNTLGRILNKNESSQLTAHWIASFSGEMDTDYNALDFYPSASRNNPDIGNYVEHTRFDPEIR